VQQYGSTAAQGRCQQATDMLCTASMVDLFLHTLWEEKGLHAPLYA